MASKAASVPSKRPIPFSIRLKAWWEGYAPEHLMPDQGAAPAAPHKPEKQAPALDDVDVALQETPLQGIDANSIDPWDDHRIDIAQLIWGRGYCGPGGPEYIIAMSKLLAMTPELSMLHLGAGLGGPARTLAEHFGVWVTGLEPSKSLANAGNHLSTMAGMTKKAPVQHLDLASENPLIRRYDRVLVDGYLAQRPNKAEALTMIDAALKPEGLLLVTDYFLVDDGSVANPDYRDWLQGEPRQLNLVTAPEFVEAATKAGLGVRVNEDRTEEHIDLIKKAWAGADKVVADLLQQPGQEHLTKIVLKEAELWSKRAKVLTGGQLQFRRILAAKREKGVKMMSNW